MSTTTLTTISIVPVNDSSNESRHSTAFREVIAYLNGVAEAMAARGDSGFPSSLLPGARVRRSPSGSAGATPTRVTLRFGELGYERASAWPKVGVTPAWETTRGGARLVDLGFVDSSAPAATTPAPRRHTLPYEAPSISLAPFLSAPPPWADERQSGVRLRTGQLPMEWYELTGTDGDTEEVVVGPYPINDVAR